MKLSSKQGSVDRWPLAAVVVAAAVVLLILLGAFLWRQSPDDRKAPKAPVTVSVARPPAMPDPTPDPQPVEDPVPAAPVRPALSRPGPRQAPCANSLCVSSCPLAQRLRIAGIVQKHAIKRLFMRRC